MTKQSAGILMYRGSGEALALLLVHPGGPFWANKDQGAWSIPKGEYETGEDPLAAAKREFAEELGSAPLHRAFLDLGAIKQPSRKMITAFAVNGDFDPATLKSNRFELEWPPKSGAKQTFPEIDRGAMVRARESARENPARAGTLHRPAARKPRRRKLREALAGVLAVARAPGIVHFLTPKPELMPLCLGWGA
jgi:predicted NUDIX family NTP pyrophosphohydrolase